MLPLPAGARQAPEQLAFQSSKGTAPSRSAQQRIKKLAYCLLQVIEPLFSLKVSSVTNEGTFKNNEFVGQWGLQAQLQLDHRQCFCQAPTAPGPGTSAAQTSLTPACLLHLRAQVALACLQQPGWLTPAACFEAGSRAYASDTALCTKRTR